MSNSIELGDVLSGVGAANYVACSPDTRVAGVTDDSREVREGHAFLAIKGIASDGHDFIDAAIEAGASVVIVERGHGPRPPVAHVVLDSTGAAHGTIAANAHRHPARRLRLAGVTGTNGKTTTAHLVSAILTGAGRPHARLGTTGNWLVNDESPAPLTTPFPFQLQSLLAQTVTRGGADAVMEVSSHALDQGRIRPLEFAAVALTSFSQDHLDFHPSMAAYLDAKCRLAREYLARDGVAIAAVDGQSGASAFLDTAAARGATTWRVSRGEDPDAEILVRAWDEGRDGLRADVVTPRGHVEVRSPLVGAFNLDNVLVALGIGLALDVDPATATLALGSAPGAPGRLERVAVTGVSGPLVLVDYAHTPDAVGRTLTALRPICDGNLVVLLGCGGDRDVGKRPQMGAVAAVGSDRFYATSDNPRTEDPAAIVDQMLGGVADTDRGKVVREVDRARAIALAIASADERDLILIAGKGHEDYQVIGTRTLPFDDREHAAAALRRRIDAG